MTSFPVRISRPFRSASLPRGSPTSFLAVIFYVPDSLGNQSRRIEIDLGLITVEERLEGSGGGGKIDRSDAKSLQLRLCRQLFL